MRTPTPASAPPAPPTPAGSGPPSPPERRKGLTPRPRTRPWPRRAAGSRPPSRRRSLAFDVLVAAAASLELLTWYGRLDSGSALVCPPALLALVVRRRFPVPVLLATLPSMATGHLWIAPMIALFTVASRTTRVPLVLGSTAALFAATLWSGYTEGTSGMEWGDHLFAVEVALMFSVGPAGLGLLSRTRSELRARLRELTASQEHGRRLEAERAVARERTRMAREMHDTVSYHLGIIATQSGALWATAPDATVRQDAETIRRHSAAALAELREVVGVLRRAAGRADDGDTARLHHLPALVRDARLDAVLDLDATLPDGRTCAPAVERAAYRTVQEALTNARKHAPGAPVAVTVRPSAQGDTLVVEVRNEAPPCGPAASSAGATPVGEGGGYGLTGLKERTALVDGTLRAGPTPDGGFAVRAELPLAPAPAAPAPAPGRRPART